MIKLSSFFSQRNRQIRCLALIATGFFACAGQSFAHVHNHNDHTHKSDSSNEEKTPKKGQKALPLPAEMYSKSAPNTQLYFLSPRDGAKVPETFTVTFGLSGMGVAPAGVKKDNTGHHHLLVDLEELPDLNLPLPSNQHVIHFGGGQTETQLTLPPGKHTLQLLLGNFVHVPHQKPVMSKKITVHVENAQ